MNRLNGSTGQVLSDTELDVDEDGFVSPLDALLVINVLNRGETFESKPETPMASRGPTDNTVLESQIAMWMAAFDDEDHASWRDADFEESLINALANYLAGRKPDETFLSV